MSIKSSVVYNSILQFSQILFPLITFPYVSRVLGPEGFGVINFTTNLSGLFISLVSLGVPLYGMREIAKLRGKLPEIKRVTSELLTLHSIYSFFGLIAYSVIIISIDKFANNKDVFLLGGLVIFFNCFSIEWLYQGLERFRFIAIRTIFIRILSIVALFVFVKTKDDLLIYMLILVLTQFFNGIVNFLYAQQTIGFSFTNHDYKRHSKNLLLLYGSSLAIAIYVQMDTVMLGFLSTEKDVGLYSATVRISKLPLAFISALSTSFIPRIALYFSEGDTNKVNRIANTSLLLITIYSIPVSFGLFLFAEELLLLFSGDSFIEAATSLRIVAFLTFVIGLSNLFGIQLLTAAKQDSALLKSVTIGTVINFLLNLLFIPYWGFNGATVATAIAEVGVTIMTFYMVHSKLSNINLNFSCIIPAIIACIPFLAVKYAGSFQEFSYLGFIVQIIICVVFYFVALRLLRSPVMSISNLKKNAE